MLRKRQHTKTVAKPKLPSQIKALGAAEVAKKTEPNKSWFKQRLEAVGLSQRQLAKALSLDPSSFNRSMKGERRVQLDELLLMAKLLQVGPETILANLGFPESIATVEIVGSVGVDGTVSDIKTNQLALAPPDLPPNTKALICRTANSPLAMFDECLLYFGELSGVAPEDIGRVCVIHYDDVTVVGVLSRGSARGRYKITVLNVGTVLEPKQVVSASPVLWIRSP